MTVSLFFFYIHNVAYPIYTYLHLLSYHFVQNSGGLWVLTELNKTKSLHVYFQLKQLASVLHIEFALYYTIFTSHHFLCQFCGGTTLIILNQKMHFIHFCLVLVLLPRNIMDSSFVFVNCAADKYVAKKR